MLGKGTNKAQEQEERHESKGKNTCHFSLEWKKIPADKVSERENHPPGRKRREGKERGKKAG